MIVEWLEIITPPGDSPENGNENIYAGGCRFHEPKSLL
jgi:hypothetical protein